MLIILAKSILLFLVCQSLHILIWRIKRPSAYLIWLFILFILVPVSGFIIYGILKTIVAGIAFTSRELVEWYGIFLLHIALSGGYTLVYPAILVFSPSLEMLKLIEKKMPQGALYEDIDLPLFDEKNMVCLRLDNLIHTVMIKEEEGGKLLLTKRGSFIAKTVFFYRRLLSLPCSVG
jgi:hypothetical protein